MRSVTTHPPRHRAPHSDITVAKQNPVLNARFAFQLQAALARLPAKAATDVGAKASRTQMGDRALV